MMKHKTRTVSSGEELAKSFTFNDLPSHVEVIDNVASAMGMNRSEFLRWCVEPHIQKFQTGELKPRNFDLDAKSTVLQNARRKERQFKEELEKIAVGKRNAYGVFRELAIQFGSDSVLKGNFEGAIERMKTANVDQSLRVLFVLYGQAVLNRRVVEAEIDAYLSGASKTVGADSVPLFEKPLAA